MPVIWEVSILYQFVDGEVGLDSGGQETFAIITENDCTLPSVSDIFTGVFDEKYKLSRITKVEFYSEIDKTKYTPSDLKIRKHILKLVDLVKVKRYRRATGGHVWES